jgi:hypothetical protein
MPSNDAQITPGPFTTEFLYAMCSQNDTVSREKCDYYLQGLLYGLNVQKSMQQKAWNLSPGNDSGNGAAAHPAIHRGGDWRQAIQHKDGGDWMAFMGLAAGNVR